MTLQDELDPPAIHTAAVLRRDEAGDGVYALERAALARWCSGDPSGFLELSAPDVVYFDPYRASGGSTGSPR